MSRGSNQINNSRKCNILWVGDLEPEVDEKYLRSIFGQNHNVKSIHIYKDKITNGKVNFAFLEFDTADIAEQVLHLFNGKEKPRYGKPFKINWGNPRTKRDRPPNMYGMNQMMPGRFPPMGGNFNPRMMPNMMGMQRMYPGMGMNPGMFPPMMGHQMRTNPEKRGENQIFSIYVGDLDEYCEQKDLTEFFQSKYRSVVGAKIIKDFTTKKNKGFGFVNFEDGNESELAIAEMNGKIFRGKRIKTGKSYTKYSNHGAAGPRSHGMFPMMNRGMNPQMGMPMGMRRPMMSGGFPAQPYPMMNRQMDPNFQKNMGRGYIKPGMNDPRAMTGERGVPKENTNQTGHYRKTVDKGSPSKKPSYMISTTQEVNQKNEKPESSERSRTEDVTKENDKKDEKEENNIRKRKSSRNGMNNKDNKDTKNTDLKDSLENKKKLIVKNSQKEKDSSDNELKSTSKTNRKEKEDIPNQIEKKEETSKDKPNSVHKDLLKKRGEMDNDGDMNI